MGNILETVPSAHRIQNKGYVSVTVCPLKQFQFPGLSFFLTLNKPYTFFFPAALIYKFITW